MGRGNRVRSSGSRNRPKDLGARIAGQVLGRRDEKQSRKRGLGAGQGAPGIKRQAKGLMARHRG